MSLSMGSSMSQRHSMRQEQNFTQEQRQTIKGRMFSVWIALVGALREEKYEPKARCPKCQRELKPTEILAGFLADVNDFTTACTGCHHRFEPRLICFGNASQIELPFYCGPQAKNRLCSVAHLPPAEIAREYPGEYRSAVVHFGTIKAMFKSLNVDYSFDELEGWEARVQPFLGRLPDTHIAKSVGVSVRLIRKLRQDGKVDRFSKHQVLATEKE
jgi:hypothetical protein